MISNEHILAIGCTGMLQQTIVQLLKDGNRISIVGRNESKLEYFIDEFPQFLDQIQIIKSDYSDEENIETILRYSSIQFGQIDCCICWMHSHAINSKTVLFNELKFQNKNIKIYEILGSAAANPANHLKDAKPYIKRIILGFVLENGNSRWLNNSEISDGCYSAIQSNLNLNIIGVVEPWEKRP